jgi:hypothetical protein
MKGWTFSMLLLCAGCVRVPKDEVAVQVTGALMDRLVQAAAISDSLKAAVLLNDEQAIRYLVRLPGGGFGFSKKYLDAIRADERQYSLVRACNVSVVTYTSLRKYTFSQLLPRLPKKVADSFERRLPPMDD